MLKTIIRGSGPAIVVLAFIAGLLPRTADADEYFYDPTTNLCYSSYSGVVPLSDCGTTSASALAAEQALAAQFAGNTAGAVAMNGVMQGVYTGPSSSGSPPVVNSYFGTYVGGSSYDVAPAAGRLSIQGVGVGGVYSRTAFSDSASGLGYSRVTQTAGITASYVQDFGDWGFTAVLPLTRSLNNSGYSAFDNTGIGLAVVPVYHLLFEQVAGVALDVGGVLGGQYTGFDDPSDLANGPIGLTGFENPASGQLGAFVTAAKTVAAATRLSLGAAFIDNHNFTGEKVFGQDTSDATASLGVGQGLSSTLSLTANLSLVNLDQYKWGIDRNYGEGALALSDRLSPRDSLTLQASQTFANSAWSTTSGTVNFVWWLN
ncbi:MAG TPA: hypothetical protein VN668_19835 [Stellaceae bacterium]|nr:hypothetical protein [Stellaceae bacterium]